MIDKFPNPNAVDKLPRESFADAVKNVEKLLEQPVINEKLLKRLIDIMDSRMIEGAKALPSEGGHLVMSDTHEEFDRIRGLVTAKGFKHLLPYGIGTED